MNGHFCQTTVRQLSDTCLIEKHTKFNLEFKINFGFFCFNFDL